MVEEAELFHKNIWAPLCRTVIRHQFLPVNQSISQLFCTRTLNVSVRHWAGFAFVKFFFHHAHVTHTETGRCMLLKIAFAEIMCA